jgi:hypothetical protein
VRSRLGVIAILLLGAAYAWPMQGGGGTPNAQYALVKALEDGTPRVEQSLRELGDFPTRDLVQIDGRLYSNKAPGLAFVTVPVYALLEASGVDVTGDPTRGLWALGLVGTVLPVVLLLIAIRAVAERVEPGYGTITAVTLGAGTLLLPYATVFFSHTLSAALVFGSFALLWRARRPNARLLELGAAGGLAGYAVITEYPNALAAAILGLYVLVDSPRLRRGAAFAVGVVVGALPGLLYNWWAFGSPFFNAYGTSPEGEPTDLWGSPKLRAPFDFFLSSDGFLVFTPVIACAVTGLVVLYRRGLRAEVLTVAGVAAAYAAVLSAYYSPFGGFLLGPRYLLAAVPLLGIGLPAAFRRAPVTSAALAAASVIVMATVTATHALAGHDGRYLDRLLDRELTLSAASIVGVTGWYAMLPFFLAVAGAVVAAALTTPLPVPRLGGLLAGAIGLAAWALLLALAPVETEGTVLRFALLLAAVAGAGAAAVLLERPRSQRMSTT